MPVHEGIRCDVCGRVNFEGLRYKCEECSNYDLCSDCHDAGATSYEHLRTHRMLCMPDPVFVVRYDGNPLDYKVSQNILREDGLIVTVEYYYTIWEHGDEIRRQCVVIRRATYESLAATMQQRTIPFEQFVKVLQAFMMGRFSTPDEITEAFNILDRDHSGRIDITEFAKFVSVIKPDVTTNQLLAYIRMVDRNMDREMNLSEFTDLILRGLGRDIVVGRIGNVERTEGDFATIGGIGRSETTGLTSDFIENRVINTRTREETHEYLENEARNIYLVDNPEIITQVMSECGTRTNEQRIHVRYFQPPDAQPPGPFIIREIRPPQPPPPPPLVIIERPESPSSLPPLILREEPPTPPTPIPSETVTRYLDPIPTPPRSVIIKRYPPSRERPRDIIIERWIPYGPQPKRKEIIHSAPPPINYPAPYYKIIQYEHTDAHLLRRFENLGVVRNDPAEYRARYGSSLLDSATLVQQAREAGVHEDITPPECPWKYGVNFHQSNEFLHRD